ETPLFVPETAQPEVDAYFDGALDGNKRVIAVHPAVDRPSKQWPVASYAALADMLLADGRFEVLITWGPGQRCVAEAVAVQAKRKPLIAPETPDLKQYAWLIHRCALYVGGDTGPMHIAAAMGTPTVAIFGGTDPAKHAPVGAPARVLYAGLEPPPGRVSTRAAQDAFARITPDDVYDACISLLTQSPAHPARPEAW
ncbi:MAG TPA: glycosyltransferase family 9 protein, partial [Candidatus Hydrogenedentes bacterium]|nr:glycosyltransferase family 9 protein [Candidatus Hydrogenedentota bacterium]